MYTFSGKYLRSTAYEVSSKLSRASRYGLLGDRAPCPRTRGLKPLYPNPNCSLSVCALCIPTSSDYQPASSCLLLTCHPSINDKQREALSLLSHRSGHLGPWIGSPTTNSTISVMPPFLPSLLLFCRSWANPLQARCRGHSARTTRTFTTVSHRMECFVG